MAETKEQGTGKHPHKSAEDPTPHHEASTTKGKDQHASSSSHSSSGKKEESGSDSSDLKSREYKDKDGNIHHHTHTAGKSEK